MKNLSVNVNEDVHLKVKMRALLSGLSLKDYFLKLIEQDLKESDENKN